MTVKVVAKNDRGNQLMPLVCPCGYKDISCQSSSGDSICGQFHGSEEVFGGFHIVHCNCPQPPGDNG